METSNFQFGLTSIFLLNILFFLIGILIFVFLLRLALRINQRTELLVKQNNLLEIIAEKLGASTAEKKDI